MNRKFILSASIAICVLGGISMAEACSGCGSSSTETTDAATLSLDGHTHQKHLSFDQLKAAVASGKYIILDARGDKYFNGELIPGAQRMASGTDAADILKALPNKEAAIITYCSNIKCPASKKLAGELAALGYTHIQEYPEGLAGWKGAGGTTKQVK